jgi:hypothetical protein
MDFPKFPFMSAILLIKGMQPWCSAVCGFRTTDTLRAGKRVTIDTLLRIRRIGETDDRERSSVLP